MSALHLVGDAHRQARDAPDVIGLAAAPERVDAGIARRLDLADRTEAARRERQRPGFDHLGAQLRIADFLDLRQLRAHPRAQIIGDGAWLEHGCLPATRRVQIAQRRARGPSLSGPTARYRFAAMVPRSCAGVRAARTAWKPRRRRRLGSDRCRAACGRSATAAAAGRAPAAARSGGGRPRAARACAQDVRRRALRLAPWHRAARAVVSWIVDMSEAPDALPVMAFQELST